MAKANIQYYKLIINRFYFYIIKNYFLKKLQLTVNSYLTESNIETKIATQGNKV